MRFPVLKQTARIRKKNVSTIVLACGILHNLLNKFGVELPEFDSEQVENVEQVEGITDWDGEIETESVKDLLVSLAQTL